MDFAQNIFVVEDGKNVDVKGAEVDREDTIVTFEVDRVDTIVSFSWRVSVVGD